MPKFEALYLGKSIYSEKVENHGSKFEKSNRKTSKISIKWENYCIGYDESHIRKHIRSEWLPKINLLSSVVDYTKTLNRLVIVGYNQLPLSSLVLIKLTLQVGMGNASELAIMISWVKSARKSKPSQSCDVFPWFIQIICSNHLTGIDELKGLYSWTWAKASWLKAIQS